MTILRTRITDVKKCVGCECPTMHEMVELWEDGELFPEEIWECLECGEYA